jgi:hypothetical protein
MTRPMLASAAVVVTAALFGVACEEKHSSSPSKVTDAGATTSKYVTADPKIEKALQAAASATPPRQHGTPPVNGIFPPGAADEEHPKGVPTKIDLISAGDEPRILLTGASADAVRMSSYGPAGLELGMQMGPRVALPVIDLSMMFGPAKKDDGGTDWLVAEIGHAITAKQQLGELPPGTDKEIATLAGTLIRIKVPSDGLESEAALRLSKTAHPELERLVQNAVESLVLATIPLPTKPVGVGAQWIAETRMPMSGLDVVAYRAYRVKSVTGDRLHLSLEVKGYAASRDPQFPGVPKGATLVQVNAEAQGEMEFVRGEVLARKSDVQQRLMMVFQAPGAATAPGADPPPEQPDPAGDQARQPPPGSTMTAQIQSQATLVRGEDLRAAMTRP